MRLARLIVFLSLALFTTVARAQSVRWEASDAGASALQLVYEDCSPDGDPQFPKVEGLTFTVLGRTSSTNIVNFDVHSSVILTVLVRSRQSGNVRIPAFSVKTNKGAQRVDAVEIGATANAGDSVASSRLIPERTALWAGEVFGLTYDLTVGRRHNPQFPTLTFDWNAAPLTIEDWSKLEGGEEGAGAARRIHATARTRAIAKTPNTVKLEAANQVINIQTGTTSFGFGGLFNQARMEPISVTSDQPVLQVKPLPPAPAGFSGAVGNFKLVSKVVPENAALGEPVTWTLELSGTGNWPDVAGLPTREVSTDFQVVQPKARRTPAEGKIFDVTLSEDVVLVPTKAGTYTLGPIAFTYFDPKSGAYKTLTTPRTTVTIGAAAPPKLTFNFGPSTPESAPAAPAAPTKAQLEELKSKIPTPPAGIPRDPLPGAGRATVPMPASKLVLFALAPFALPLVVWLWLAVRRALHGDPVRPRREARARLARTLAQIRTTPPTPQILLAWQRDAAVLWQVAHAAPSASAFPDAAWNQLWTDCDRALYGAKLALPPDWTARAEAALEATRVPGFNPLRAFLPRNLFPFAALLVLGLLLPSSFLLAAASGSDGVSAYRRGDFTAAEKAWRAAVASTPTDWIARHNLSLALAQLDRASESAAHAVAAFVQQPANPAVNWHFALAGEKAGFVPTPLAGFINPGPLHALAQHASPSEWQFGIVTASAVVALAAALLLVNAYGRRSPLVTRSAAAVLVLASVFAAVSVISWQAYGSAGDERAVVIWRAGTLRSVPTEADTTQKTTALTPGNVAIADKTFLGWTRLAFENGQTGWVRTGELIPLWR